MGEIKAKLKRCYEHIRRTLQKLNRNEKIILAMAGIFLLVGLMILIAPKRAKVIRAKEQKALTEAILLGEESVPIQADLSDGVIGFYEEEADALDYFGEATASSQEEEKESKVEVVGIGILEIPAIDLRLPVAEGVKKSTLKVAIGHVSETATIGQEGNAVLAGHRSYTKGEFFNRLDEVKADGTVQYTDKAGTIYRFKVIDIQTIEPSSSKAFDVRTGKSDLTLYTCTPVRVASHRLLIRCSLEETIR